MLAYCNLKFWGGVSMKRLIEMKNGEKAEVLDFLGRHEHHGHKHGSLARLQAMGLRKGEIIEMITNQKIGPILIRAGETRIAIGRGIAAKIAVELLTTGCEHE